MNITDRVFQSMRYDKEVSPEEIAAITHLDLQSVSTALNMLARGGVIECTQKDRFIRNRKFKSKQRDLIGV